MKRPLALLLAVGLASATPRPAVQADPAADHGTHGLPDPGQRTTVPEASAAVPVASSGPRTHHQRVSAGTRGALVGIASWYRWRPGQAAAGPALRAALGSGWRGRFVTACNGSLCALVRLTDWCGCPSGRIIDLDAFTFAALTVTRKSPDGRLGLGLLEVRVSW